MQRDEFADLWAAKWSEMLKIASDNNSAFGTDRKPAYAYYQWIREQMRKDTPLDQFVRQQIAASGSNIQDPAVNLYTMIPAGNYDPKAVALDIAQVFTGIRIQCSQCHNHPFDRWTQDDFYGFVSFFTGVKRKEASEAREFYVWDDPNAAPAKHLLDNHPCPPKFLGGAEPDVKGKDPRVALADWLTSKDNDDIPPEHGKSHLGAFRRAAASSSRLTMCASAIRQVIKSFWKRWASTLRTTTTISRS